MWIDLASSRNEESPPMTKPSTNPHSTAKHTLTLLGTVYQALRKSAAKRGLEPNEVIVNLIVDLTISDGTLEEYTKGRIVLERSLIGRVVEAAKRQCAEGRFTPSITLDAIRTCTADAQWKADYQRYVEDDIYKNGNPLKGPINREFGYRVRAAIGGVVDKDEAGKSINTKVVGEIIQSYTPMVSFDPNTVVAE
jgi:hypothetical protein